MVKIKVSKLIGAALDWAVARAEEGEELAEGWHPHTFVYQGQVLLRSTPYEPSVSWEQAGPIIAREQIGAVPTGDAAKWRAHKWDDTRLDLWPVTYGPTSLIAAMRCYVASKLGDEIEVPDELAKGTEA